MSDAATESDPALDQLVATGVSPAGITTAGARKPLVRRGRRIIRGRPAQWLRRACQLAVVLFVVWGALNVAWRNFKLAHNSARLVELMEGPVWSSLYAVNEALLGLWSEPYAASLDFLGLPWAATVGGVGTADPVLVLSHVTRADAFDWSLVWGLLVPLGLAAALGRVFCSHLCPMRLAFEFGQWVRGGLLYLGVPLFMVRAPMRFGGWVLAGGLIASSVVGSAVWLFVLPYVGLSAGLFLVITGGVALPLLGAVFVLWFTDVVLAPGEFCRAVCPTGWLLGLTGRLRSLRLSKAQAPACPDGCVACIRACPYRLSPRTLSARAEPLPDCDNCGRCVPACPDGKLSRRLRIPALMLALAALGAGLVPGVAEAHHNKGLPHYGYFENYPQVPTEEHVVVDGRWEFGATIFNFQGLDRRTADTPNDVKFYTYVYDLERDAPYDGPVEVEVRLDGVAVTRFAREKPDEELIYVSRETLPASGDYELVALIPTGPAVVPVTLPFYINLADEVNWLLIGLFGVPVALLFGLALLGRTKRGRARLQKMRAANASTGAALLAGLSAALAAGRAHAQSAADCADPQSVAKAVIDANGRATLVMDGMPPLMFVAGMAAIIVLSFVVIERFGVRPASTWRRNIIKNRRIYEFLRTRAFPAVPQLLMVSLLGALIYAGLAGSRVRNITPVAVWTIWWAGLVVVVAAVGPMFCAVCPWDGLTNLASRLRAFLRVEPISLGLSVPERLRNVYPAIALFVLLSWAELGLDTTVDPRQTAYLGLGMAAAAVCGALVFRGKAFCEHACPVGRISGLYANFSPFELRPRNPRACTSCETEDCLNGNERGYPCPTGISLKTTIDSTMCTLCTECIKSCPRYNVAFNLRMPGADLHRIAPVRLDHAWLALILLSLTLFHGLSMTTTWYDPLPGRDSMLKWIGVELGLPKVAAFTLAMALIVALPIALYALACKAAARWTRKSGVPLRRIFARYAFALLPVALFYHLAHNAMHLLMEGGAIVPLLSDPLGDGRDLFGTADVRIGHLLGEDTLWLIQLGLVLVGHLIGVVVAHRISRRLFDDRRHALRSLIPMTAVMVLMSVAGLSLMAMDMTMKLGRA